MPNLLESLVLGLLGGLVGLGLAFGGVRLLIWMGPETLPRLNEIALDPAVLAFTPERRGPPPSPTPRSRRRSLQTQDSR